MKIVNIPSGVLSGQSKPVKTFDKKLHKFIDEMIVTLEVQKDPEGVGLAAPQVGILKQIFIIKPTKKSKPQVFINAAIMEHGTRNTQHKKEQKKIKHRKLEGCLSIPRIWGPVERIDKILVKYHDKNGKHHEEWFTGFKAIIIQHEIDHLNGVLFTQRVMEQRNKLYKETKGELKEIDI